MVGGEDNVLELAESIRKFRKSTRNFRTRTERRAGRRNRRLEMLMRKRKRVNTYINELIYDYAFCADEIRYCGTEWELDNKGC